MRLIKDIYSYILKKRNPNRYAKMLGVDIKNSVKLNGSPNWGSEPWLVTVGDRTEISFGVTFITHDGSTWVFRNQEKYKDVLRFGRISVGDNCFIGANSTILPGVKVGDGAIVGACSLVTKNIPAGEIWGGVPARYISTVGSFAEKCLRETPRYEVEQYKKDFKNVVLELYGNDKNM